MKKSQARATTAKNLEERFDRSEEVLDYFDLSKAGVVHPQSKDAAGKKTGLFALLYKFRDRPIFFAELSDAVFEMVNAADGTEDQPQPSTTRPRFSSSRGITFSML